MIIDWLHRWVWSDLWLPVWPNLVAACIPTLTVLQLWKVVKRHHAEHMQKMHTIHQAIERKQDD